MTQEHITYQQQYRTCGKPSCRTCQSGSGHGPYWYGVSTVRDEYGKRVFNERGNPRQKSHYYGKTKPKGAHE